MEFASNPSSKVALLLPKKDSFVPQRTCAIENCKVRTSSLRWYSHTNWTLIVAVSLIGCSNTSHDDYAQLVSDLGGTMHVHVELGGTKITDADLASLDFPDTVRSISLCDSAITDRGARELTRGLNLEQIDLTNTQITDATLKELQKMPRLCEANVASQGVSPQAFGKIRFFISDRLLTIEQRSPIQPLPRLPKEGTQSDAVDDPLPPPENLGGYDTDVKSCDGEIQIHLDFHNSNITDSDLADIPLPENIRTISLRGTAITDKGVGELIRARNLEILDLRNTKITNDVLTILKPLPRIWKVNVGSTNVSAPVRRELIKMLAQKRRSIAYDRTQTMARPPTPP